MNRTTLLRRRSRPAGTGSTAALAAFADDAMLERIDETWTRKDVLAHLEAWERRVVENLATPPQRGDTPDGSIETDELNERLPRPDRDRSLDDVRAGERAAYRAVLAAIDGAIATRSCSTGSHFAWTEGDPFADWFRGNTDEHYDEHLEQLTPAPRR